MSRIVSTLWREYRLVEALAETAAHFLGRRDFARAREAIDALSRALTRELDDEERLFEQAERATATALRPVDELRDDAGQLVLLLRPLREALLDGQLPSAAIALARLREALARHQAEAAAVVYPISAATP